MHQNNDCRSNGIYSTSEEFRGFFLYIFIFRRETEYLESPGNQRIGRRTLLILATIIILFVSS